MTDFSKLNRREMYLLSALRKHLLKDMIDQNQALVQAFRRELQDLNYSMDRTQVAYNLFVTPSSEIDKLDRKELQIYRIYLGGREIPTMIRDKYKSVQSNSECQQRCPFILQNTFIIAFLLGYLPVFLDGLNKCCFKLSEEKFGILEFCSSLGIVGLAAFLKLSYRYKWLKTKPIALTEGNKLASDQLFQAHKRLSLRGFQKIQKERRRNTLA